MLEKDPIENDNEIKKIIEMVEHEVRNLLAKEGKNPQQLGYIHYFDNLKKQILKQKYNIDWKTTQEMNPDIIID